MFVREGFARHPRLNVWVAGCLASVAGFVDSAGFVLLGRFTSHVTGSVGRSGIELVNADWASARGAVGLVLGFFCGSIAASLVIEGSSGSTPRAYGYALLLQALVLASFAFLTSRPQANAVDSYAILLCVAMGMQNSLVTRLSGAVVRTTHLTGVVTDLGIEAVRWYRWQRERMGLPAVLRGRAPPTRPSRHQWKLLLTIVMAFCVGVLAGASVTSSLQHWALLVPTFATLALSAYAFSQRAGSSDPPVSDG